MCKQFYFLYRSCKKDYLTTIWQLRLWTKLFTIFKNYVAHKDIFSYITCTQRDFLVNLSNQLVKVFYLYDKSVVFFFKCSLS